MLEAERRGELLAAIASLPGETSAGRPQVVTIATVMSWEPCAAYPERRWIALFGDRETIGVREVVDWDIPAADRFWVLVHREFTTAQVAHVLAAQIAANVLPLFEQEHPGDRRPRLAVATKRAWVDGLVGDRRLDAACAAAWRAARDTSSAAAWAAARAAARTRPRGALWKTACAAAWGEAGWKEAACEAAWGQWLTLLADRIVLEDGD